MAKPTTAVLGMGNMGAAMAGTLRRAGVEVVVWNRTASTADEVASRTGASTATSAADAAAAADVVMSSVADDAAVLDLYLGAGAAASGLRPGAVVLEMSTIDPRTLPRIAEAVTAAGAELVDAPVSGSVPLVEQGSLTVMAGGTEAAVEKARPILDLLAARVFHVGPLGAGATMKLAVNAIVHATVVAVSEALVLAERSGVDRSTAYEVFAASAIGSPFITYKRGAFEEPEAGKVAFSLGLVAKDLALIAGLADAVGAPMRQLEASQALVSEAVAAGLGASDMSIVAQYLRERAAGGE